MIKDSSYAAYGESFSKIIGLLVTPFETLHRIESQCIDLQNSAGILKVRILVCLYLPDHEQSHTRLVNV
jgi:hypothetical protein